jgi:hypothetical protein
MTNGMFADVRRWTTVVFAAGVIVAAAPALAWAVQASGVAPRGPESRTMPSAGDPLAGAAHGGVIRPPLIGDSAISLAAPRSEYFATPVIPPPGTPGSHLQAAPAAPRRQSK